MRYHDEIEMEFESEDGETALPIAVAYSYRIEKDVYGSDAEGNRGEDTAVIDGLRIDAIYSIETGADITNQFTNEKKWHIFDKVERNF